MCNLQDMIKLSTDTRTDDLSRGLDHAVIGYCLILPSELPTYDVAEEDMKQLQYRS